jgi:hypothetical protein
VEFLDSIVKDSRIDLEVLEVGRHTAHGRARWNILCSLGSGAAETRF